MPKQLTVSKLIKKLDRIFSLYIRLRDSGPNGYGKCCTCGKVGHYKSMNAGHFQSRGNHGTRYMESNVHLQCIHCNLWRDGAGPDYFRFMQDKYGDEVIDEIRANKLGKFTAWDLEEDIKNYQKLVKEMT
ncbi:hypothetical protein LCGC14_2811280 [marine sediment metagenome]|uniref:Protein ninG n=1 Tax=marine sediment metagenome TaxID=412755 RepID=A0A0F8YJS1_9ZZZZ